MYSLKIALLLLKEKINKPLRKLEDYLNEMPGILGVFDIEESPDFSPFPLRTTVTHWFSAGHTAKTSRFYDSSTCLSADVSSCTPRTATSGVAARERTRFEAGRGRAVRTPGRPLVSPCGGPSRGGQRGRGGRPPRPRQPTDLRLRRGGLRRRGIWEGPWLDGLVVRADRTDSSQRDGTQNTKAFGIDRGDDNTGSSADESRLDRRPRASVP